MKALRSYLAIALVFLLSACASQPERSEALERAEQAVATAEQNPAVAKHAEVELKQARQALKAARDAWKDGDDADQVEHLAYVAQRRAQAAEALARQTTAQELAAKAAQERQQVVLESRERETQMAREEAQLQRQLAEQTRRELDQAQQRLTELEPKQTERGLVLTLGSFLFNLDSADLKPEAQESIDKLARFLRENPDREVLIEGYTDTSGPSAYNEQLSQERAQAIVRALTRSGIDANRLRAVGYGERYPVASNDTASGRAQNRRVELVVSEQPPQIRGQAGGQPPAAVPRG